MAETSVTQFLNNSFQMACFDGVINWDYNKPFPIF